MADDYSSLKHMLLAALQTSKDSAVLLEIVRRHHQGRGDSKDANEVHERIWSDLGFGNRTARVLFAMSWST